MTSAISGRIRPVGLGVILFALLILVIPLRMFYAGGHPLAAVEGVDLCALLAGPALAALPGSIQETRREIPGFADRPTGTCYVRLKARDDETNPPEISLALMNRNYLARGNIRFKTAKYFETFLEEERASGNVVEPVTGPWRSGSSIRRRGTEERLDVLTEDDGVVLWFRAQGFSVSELIPFAAAASLAVRGTEGRPGG